MALPPAIRPPKGWKPGKKVPHRSSFSAPSQRPRATGRVYVPRSAAKPYRRQAAPQATPSVQRAAKAQGRYYASQGRTVARRAYLSKPLAERKKIVREARGKSDAESRQIIKIHEARVARGERRAAQGLAARAGYVSQGRAVGKVAKEQRTLARVQAPGRYYASLGKAVEHVATERQAKDKNVLFSKDPKVLKAAGFHEAGIADKLMALPTAAAGHAPKDIGDLVVNTPTSLAKLASTAATHPEKVPGMLAEPYKQAFKDPIKFATERPVTSFLMFAPTVKAPGLAAGRVARLAGKQSLARPAATLEGTTIRAARTGSRDVFKRAEQARRDRANPNPQLTTKPGAGLGSPTHPFGRRTELERRVDEFKDYSKYHIEHVVAKKTAETKKATKHLPKAERQAKIEDAASGARGGAQQEIARRGVREFGSHWRVAHQPSGKPQIVKPKHATEGHLHDSRADAQHVADKLPFTAKVVEDGTGKFGAVPDIVARRYASHSSVERNKSLGGKLLKASSRTFRGTVLPTSGKWLAGQFSEAGFRAAIHGAGPTSLLRARLIVKEMNRRNPGSGDALLQRAASGGKSSQTSILRTDLGGAKTLADDFKDTPLEYLATHATRFGKAPGARHIRHGWNRYQQIVFDQVNGIAERTTQKAMLGKEIAKGPLMERRILTLSDKAIKEAADGLTATHTQVELGRAVDRAYGSYSKFSPDMREALAHNTPFLPWYLNTGKFLLSVLPKDHPLYASLGASVNEATEQWRRAHGRSLHGKKIKPPFMLGTYPVGKSGYKQVGRYLPFSPGDPEEAIGSLLFPQVAGVEPLKLGVDWKGNKIRGGFGAKSREAGLSIAEAHVPGFTLATKATGFSGTLHGKKTAKAERAEARKRGVLGQTLRQLNPAATIEPHRGKKKGKKRKGGGLPKLPGGGGGGGGGLPKLPS